MPYTEEQRRVCAPIFPDVDAENVGDLTYQLQVLVEDYLDQQGLSYQTIAEITGAINQLQRDFDERISAPYEARKRKQNGDVWQSWETYVR